MLVSILVKIGALAECMEIVITGAPEKVIAS
jgi:hypothetical protein